MPTTKKTNLPHKICVLQVLELQNQVACGQTPYHHHHQAALLPLHPISLLPPLVTILPVDVTWGDSCHSWNRLHNWGEGLIVLGMIFSRATLYLYSENLFIDKGHTGGLLVTGMVVVLWLYSAYRQDHFTIILLVFIIIFITVIWELKKSSSRLSKVHICADCGWCGLTLSTLMGWAFNIDDADQHKSQCWTSFSNDDHYGSLFPLTQ